MDIDLLDSSTQDPDFFFPVVMVSMHGYYTLVVVGVKELLPPPVSLR